VELLVDKRDQSLESALVAPSPFEQQSGHLRVVISNRRILGPFSPFQLFVTGSRFLDREQPRTSYS
jgi:hypothetical protein